MAADRVIVQKFGGTSVADPARVRRCAERVARAADSGAGVVVTVSAMGKTTDALVALAEEAWGGEASTAPRREMDMLLSTGEQVTIAVMAMTLASMGRGAVSFTGRQIGLTTDDAYSRARISSIDADRVRRELDAGRIVVVAGFQGATPEGEITTLGRGGSDTTAVAVAAALGAEACEIYTDVDGVYTADPRRVPGARRRDRVSYEAMLEMAALGATVLHPRAVQFGAKFGVPIRVLHSQRDGPGTLICSAEEADVEKIRVTGVTLKGDLGRVTLSGLPDRPGVVAGLFARLASGGVVVDDIIQTVLGEGASRTATVSFTVDRAELEAARAVIDGALAVLGSGEVAVTTGLAKVSAAGVGIRSHADVAALMFRALADAGINIANITTSEVKVSVILRSEDGERALRLAHDAFGLGEAD